MVIFDYTDPCFVVAGFVWRLAVLDRQPDKSPTDLTGWSAGARVRSTVGAATVELELTTGEGGGIVITEEEGRIDLAMTEEQTAALAKGPHVVGVYAINPSGDEEHLFDLSLIVVDSAARPAA